MELTLRSPQPTAENTLNKELAAKENEVKLEQFKTELRKSQFIEEIKGDLGVAIKLNPRKVRIIKKPWHVKFKNSLAKLFTKF
jgi:hypothetical protein